MGGIELWFGKLVWTYPSSNDNLLENKHNILLNKKKREDNANFKVCLKLTGFSEEDLSRQMFTLQKQIDELVEGIAELKRSKGVTFATGTPISNSMVELYTMQRYLQYDSTVM